MNCEEFEEIGLDAGTNRITAAEQAAAAEHAAKCAKCAALADSWESVRAELVVLADTTRKAETPARVQMRVLQELRGQKRPHEIYRRTGMIASWGLAAAGLIVGVIGWLNWHKERVTARVGETSNGPVLTAANVTPAEPVALVSDEDTGAFTPLPGALPISAESDSIYEVRMQRASLSALGLPVSGESAADWLNVDLLVADDGTPQGIRLHQDASDSGTL